MNEQREDRQVTGPTLRVVRSAAARWRWLLLNETGIRTEWEALWGCATREQVSIYFPCHSIDEIRDRMCQPVAESNQRLARVPRPFGARRAAGSPFSSVDPFPNLFISHRGHDVGRGRVRRRRCRNWRPRNVGRPSGAMRFGGTKRAAKERSGGGTPCRPQSDAMMLMFKDWLTSIDRCGRLGSSMRGLICPCVAVNEGQRAGSAGSKANKKKGKAPR